MNNNRKMTFLFSIIPLILQRTKIKNMKKKQNQPKQETVITEQETVEQVHSEKETMDQVTEQETTEQVMAEETINEQTINEQTDIEQTINEQTDTEQTAQDSAPDYRQSEAFLSLSAPDQEAVGQWLDQLICQLSQRSLTADNLKSVLNALHYDRDVAQAGIDGEVRGRNTRIEELFEQRRKVADIHVLNGAAASVSPTPPPNILGGLTAADRQTIWERGNEKRVTLR